MNEQTAPAAIGAKEALELWDKGEAIAAFEVETQRCTQQEIYTVAFEMIRGGRLVRIGGVDCPEIQRARGDLRQPDSIMAKISKRELDVAHSIAYVAMLKGWGEMVAQHLAGGHIKAITVKKG
jgi:hypothetical protein